MNILFVTPDCPYPPQKSGGIHTVFNLVKSNTKYDIDLIYYGDEDVEARSELERLNIFNSISYVPAKRREGILGRMASILRHKPYAQYRFDFSDFSKLADYDLVVFDQFASEPLAQKDLAKRQICFVLDSMPRYFERKSAVSGGFISSLYYRLQSSFAKKEEKRTIGHIEKLMFVSEEDASYSASLYHENCKCRAIAMGVDSTEGVTPLDLGKSIVFTGVMDYAPNEDAALFYLKDVFPYVRKQHPDVTLYLVGKNPTERLTAVCQTQDEVVLTGFVESVIAYILGATVYVSPLRFGTGVKNKVLEAMSCRVPMVLSGVSAEGIPECKPDANCLMADTTEDWIKQTCRLLEDGAERERLVRGVAATFGANRSWADALDTLVQPLD